MGGGMSTSSGLEEMINATHMVGRAIAAITFPGMHRIYDFHSIRAPKLKSMSSFFMFNHGQDDEDDDEFNENQFTSEELEKIFFVQVGNDKVYLEDPLYENESGWTPLHTCCMSFLTVPAGLKLIEYISENGGSFDTKTIIGPGTFNKGWTPLHMACAYGIEPLVVKLLEAGANPNPTNCYGYTPLLEATHRGFMTIASILVKHGARMDYIPPEELSRASPFISTPSQSPLGEAARCGYSRIVQDLIDKGAPKNLGNSLGWTPLHEACFYNRIETVKVLLLSGADSSIRSQSGALPFHLAGLQTIRDMIRDMGCNGSVPRNERDTIDMMTILQELTYSSSERSIVESIQNDRHKISNDNSILSNQNRVIKEHSKNDDEKNDDEDGYDYDPDAKHLTESSISNYSKQKQQQQNSDSNTKNKESKHSSESQLLHSGPLLGNLPLLNQSNPTPTKQKTSSPSPNGKKKKNIPSATKESNLPKDLPKEFICELCQRQMIDPVKSIYGNFFERSVIEEWLKNQGKICPITGAPLSEADLTPNEELKIKIRKWILQKSISPDDSPLVPNNEVTSASPTSLKSKNKNSPTKGTNNNKSKVGNNSVEDDLYDF